MSEAISAKTGERLDLARRIGGIESETEAATGNIPGERNPVRASLERFRRQVRRKARNAVQTTLFGGLSSAGRLHPRARLDRHNVEQLRDIPYRDTGLAEHTLDVYRPIPAAGEAAMPRPVVLYVHGGGFSLLSKETHWIMGLLFAKFGYTVFNVSYRLAPKHPYPAALEDVCAAYEWMLDHAEFYGGDLSRIVVAGESAGANLVTALSTAACYERPEPFAKRVFDRDRPPDVAVPACGIFQVSEPERLWQRRALPPFVKMVLSDVSDAYLPGGDQSDDIPSLADPLLVLEQGEQPARPLPAFFLPVGTADPLLDDTRRLHAALESLGVASEAKYYEREIHAFHAFVWRRASRDCWRHTFEFAARHLGER